MNTSIPTDIAEVIAQHTAAIAEAEVNDFNARAEAEAAEQRKRDAESYDAYTQEHEAQQSTEQAGVDELLSVIAGDPVAIAVLKLFVAISRERDGYREAVDELNDAMLSQGEHYERRTSELKRAAEQQARSLNDELDDARSRADDLESDLKKASKQLQRGF